MYTDIANLRLLLDPLVLAQWATDQQIITTQADAADALDTDPSIQANIDKAIQDSSLYIDHILNGCLDMTLAANQVAVEQYCVTITKYKLSCRHHATGDSNPYYQEYRDTVRDLEKIAQRKRKVARNPERPTGTVASTSGRRESVLSDDNLSNY